MNDSPFTTAADFPPVSYETWRETVQRSLAEAPFDKLKTKLYGGLEIEPLYARAQWDGAGDPSGFPGAAPFTRGGNKHLSLVQGWEICAEQRHNDPIVANKQILEDLAGGAQSILLRIDRAAGSLFELCIEDISIALADVMLDAAPVRLLAGTNATEKSLFLAAVWRRRGIAPDKALGAFNADPLGALAEHGDLGLSVDNALREMTALAEWTQSRYPLATAVGVSTVHYHTCGATDVEDLAFAMSTGLAYLRAMLEAGMAADDACRQIVFMFAMDCHQFANISKLRAARRLWSRIAGACGAMERGQRMEIHAVVSPRVIMSIDQATNILRSTQACFSAIIGGANIVTAAAHDQLPRVPPDEGRRIARNTQIILQEEAQLGRVVDPAGGSWFVESLTEQLAQKAWALFQEIEMQGGMAAALTSGSVSRRVKDSYAARLANIAKRKDGIVGVNEFPDLNEPLRESPGIEFYKDITDRGGARRETLDKCPRLHRRIAGLNHEAVDALVHSLANGADFHPSNLNDEADGVPASMPPIERIYFSQFETLRDLSDLVLQEKGRRPAVFMAQAGPLAQRAARDAFCKNFFAAGGFESVEHASTENADAVAAAFKESGARTAIIVAPDKLYPELIPALAPQLKAAGAQGVLLAGHPGANREAWSAAGIDVFIHVGCDAVEVLNALMELEEPLQ